MKTYSPRELGMVLFGSLFSLLIAYFDLFTEEFERYAVEIDQLATEVTNGGPSLISYTLDASGAPTGLTTVSLPTAEIKAFRQAREAGAAATTPSEIAATVGALAISGIQERVRIGEVDISYALVGGQITVGVNSLPRARLNVDFGLLGSAPIDYWGPVRWEVAHGAHGREMFAGAVQEARAGEPAILECEGAIELVEHNLDGVVAANVSGGELIRSVMQQAGVGEDALVLDEPPSPQLQERFEVFVPITGIDVTAPVNLGPITIVPLQRCRDLLAAFDLTDRPAENLMRAFENGTSYGLAVVDASTLHEAEEAGWARVETAVAWLIVRERNGFARLPDGRPQSFSRQQAIRNSQAGPVVLVHGTKTHRQWLRRPRGRGQPLPRPLTPDSQALSPQLPDDLTARERRSLLSLRRSIAEVVTEAQIQALWEALESYAAGVKGPEVLSAVERKRLKNELPDWLTEAQRQKVAQSVSDLNQPPFLARLRLRIERDGVPMSSAENDLLFGKLRKARNNIAHGDEIKDPPTRAEMLLATSFVARVVLNSIAARTMSTDDERSGQGPGQGARS